jgi:rhodanese-related sulfurtransferase
MAVPIRPTSWQRRPRNLTVLLAVAMLIPSFGSARSQQAPSGFTVDYTGALFGYYRIEPTSSKPVFPAVDAFDKERVQHHQALLLGMGDNFAPEFGASLQLTGDTNHNCYQPIDTSDTKRDLFPPQILYKEDSRVAKKAEHITRDPMEVTPVLTPHPAFNRDFTGGTGGLVTPISTAKLLPDGIDNKTNPVKFDPKEKYPTALGRFEELINGGGESNTRSVVVRIERRGITHRRGDSLIPRDRDVILYCTCPSEETSAKLALQLHRFGVNRVRPLRGGFEGWRDARATRWWSMRRPRRRGSWSRQ